MNITRLFKIGKAALMVAFFLFIFNFPMDISATSSFEKPDFAFPAAVENDARPRLETALSEKNGVEAINAAIQIIVARNLVSKETFSENVALLDTLRVALPQPYSGLCCLLEARLYNSLYSSNRWQFNQRNLPLDVFPDDPLSWSRDLFALKISKLVSDSEAAFPEARKMPIADISAIITNEKDASKAGLTVYDFIVYDAIDILNDFAITDSSDVIPFYKDANAALSTPGGRCYEMKNTLLDELYDYRVKDDAIAPLTVVICRKVDNLPDSERIPFIRDWALKLADNSESGNVLHRYYEISSQYDYKHVSDGQSNKELSEEVYNLLDAFLKKFPKSQYAGVIRYDIAQITEEKMRLYFPDSALPDTPLKGRVSVSNMNEGYLLIYRMPEKSVPMNSLARKDFPSKGTYINRVKISFDGKSPFVAEKVVQIPGLPAGYYVIVPSKSPRLSSSWKNDVNEWQLNTIAVSDISVISSLDRADKNSGRIYVVDSRTQRPISGATVGLYDNDNSKKLIKRLSTGSDGSCLIPEGNYRIRASYGNSIRWVWSDFHTYDSDKSPQYNARVLTDLSIYKPGGEIGFSVVAWISENHKNTLLKNESVKVELRDANYKTVETVSLETDKFGRCHGKFRLPDNGLLGGYTLLASLDKKNQGVIGRQYVQVAEYKTPGFLVNLESEADTLKSGDMLKFTGSVATYSGVPLGDCNIKYTVNWQPWWRWWMPDSSPASYGGTVVASSDGKFEIILPSENLKGTRFEHGIFSISVEATSPSGETQGSPVLRFTLGEAFNVRPSLPSTLLAKGEELTFNVPVYDMLDHPVAKEVEYAIVDMNDGKTVTSGKFTSPLLKLSSSLLPSSRYDFKFNIVGDTVKQDSEIVIYRADDSKPPYATPLWLPESSMVVAENASDVDVTVGSGYPGSWLLCEISDENNVIRREWVKADGENVKIKVKAPAPDNRIWVTLCGLHDLMQEQGTVVLIPESQTRNLEVKASSFRDKISAADKEEWKFSFTIDGDMQPGIPAMAVMSNKALNAIAPFEWNFSVGTGFWYKPNYIRYQNPGNFSTGASFSRAIRYKGVGNVIPYWQTYSYNLAGGERFGRMMIRGQRNMYRSISDSDDMVMEEAVVNEVMMDAAPMAFVENKMMAKKESVTLTSGSGFEEEASEEGAMAGGASSEKPRPRPVEMPLAFFMPDLVGDSTGNVSVKFEVPDFNTTWQFQIAGYTEDLLTARLVKDAVASKPVMVQSNLPRFLRTGDKAQVSALLFNNSDATLPIHGEIRVFDPFTDQTITSFHLGAEDVAPAGNRVITVEFPVPSDISAIGVAAYALSDKFSDGEQSAIPVLPSSAPVVESEVFYLGEGAREYSMKLPKYPNDANVTLKYCDNPVWECVMALPAIVKPESKNILAQMRALYGNAIALDVATKYPEVKAGIEKSMAKKDSLFSSLQKDSGLKIVELGNTPWVNNAESETERLRSLSTLLDSEKGKDVIADILDNVKGLQNADGGWSWCEGMPSSYFMTGQVLLHFGMMKQIGCLPDGTADMIRRGISYCDKELYKSYIDNKKYYSVTSMLSYLYIRSFFDAGDGPSGFSSMKSDVLGGIVAEWRGFSIYDRATAAILLSRSKGYEREARIILESLAQFASKSEAKGWWFDNVSSGFTGWPKLITTAQALEAYSEIEPQAPAVDGIRQWLVLQKETEDWGANSYTAEVIQAILSSGSKWTGESPAPEISLGGKSLELGSGEGLAGNYTIQFDPKMASGKKISVKKSGPGPSWGGVISQYVAPVKDVKSADCANLKVKKQIFLVSTDESGEHLSTPKNYKVGDKVRVTLTVTCDKDMDYVALVDDRASCLEPDVQLSGYTAVDGLWLYREVRDTRTSFFIGHLPKGVNVISYDCHIDRAGEYAVGIASAQSQYSPMESAHSSGMIIKVSE